MISGINLNLSSINANRFLQGRTYLSPFMYPIGYPTGIRDDKSMSKVYILGKTTFNLETGEI
jgi:hypothetical protein